MTVDTHALVGRIDLLSLVGRDTRLRKVAGTNQGEWAGACPFCGGRDRFRVQPEQRRWWCRQCSPDEHWSDAIDYVRRSRGGTFLDAVEALGASDSEAGVSTRPYHESAPEPRPGPDPDWQARTWQSVMEWKRILWSPAGGKALAWLRDRGLQDAWIRDLDLGLQPEPDAPGLRRGITIPWIAGSDLLGVKVRRPVTTAKERYWAVPGSSLAGLYGSHMVRPGQPAIVCEGELDAALGMQQLAGGPVVATSGVRMSLDAQAMRALLAAPRWLIAYDADERGDQHADSLVGRHARAVRIRPPEGKDVTEYHQRGGDVCHWLLREMRLSEEA